MKKILVVISIIFIISDINAQEITIATYNIRSFEMVDYDEGHGWSDRVPIICDLIKFHEFDILGVQEATHKQLLDMLEKLEQYRFVGCARDNGQQAGEYAAILFDSTRIRVISSRTFCLSENIETPTIGWDAGKPRICTWGHFVSIDTNKDFWFLNTHFDQKGVEARKKSAELIVQKIEEIVPRNASVILTGDFNADQISIPYRIIESSHRLIDSYKISLFNYAYNGTYNNFDINRVTTERMDHIFVSPNIDVKKYGILTDIYWTEDVTSDFSEVNKRTPKFPSDHFPVMAKIKIY